MPYTYQISLAFPVLFDILYKKTAQLLVLNSLDNRINFW